jgi:hypothetical protein
MRRCEEADIAILDFSEIFPDCRNAQCFLSGWFHTHHRLCFSIHSRALRWASAI